MIFFYANLWIKLKFYTGTLHMSVNLWANLRTKMHGAKNVLFMAIYESNLKSKDDTLSMLISGLKCALSLLNRLYALYLSALQCVVHVPKMMFFFCGNL